MSKRKEGFIRIYESKPKKMAVSRKIEDSNGRQIMIVRTFQDVPQGYMHWVGPWNGRHRLMIDVLDPDIGTKHMKLGVGIVKMGNEMSLHSHDVEEAYMVIRGKGIMYTDKGDEYEVGPWDAIYNSPNVIHCLKNIGEEDLWIVWAWAGPQVKGWTEVSRYVQDSEDVYGKK
jgi:mannose-6-phosphate isomerase-like protein (cupin superfamily)